MEAINFLQFFYFAAVDQTFLNSFTLNHTRLRDFYHNTVGSGLGTQVVFANLVASKLNATLITMNPLSNPITRTYPAIFGAHAVDNSKEGLWKVWRKYYPTFPKRPRIMSYPQIEYNFVYCAVSNKEKISVTDFSVFTSPFDYRIWALIFVAIIFIMNLVPEIVTLQTLCSLLQVNSGRKISRKMKTSWLLILWIIFSIIVTNFYTGKMTSELIIPPEDKVISTVKELDKNNYSLIFGTKSTAQYVETIANASIDNNNKIVYKSIRHLLQRSEIIESLGNEEKLASELISRDRTSTLAGCQQSIRLKMMADELLNSKNEMTKKCNVGKEIIPSESYFTMLLPPENDKVAKVYTSLVGSGIWIRWYHEFRWVAAFSRVQDRTRSIGSCQILHVKTEAVAVILKGKVLSIFLLWIYGVVFTIGEFFVETFIWSSQRIIQFDHIYF